MTLNKSLVKGLRYKYAGLNNIFDFQATNCGVLRSPKNAKDGRPSAIGAMTKQGSVTSALSKEGSNLTEISEGPREKEYLGKQLLIVKPAHTVMFEQSRMGSPENKMRF